MNKVVRFAVAALACWAVLGGNPGRAAALEAQMGACGPDVVPVVLTGEPKDSAYPQPVCSKCKQLTVERSTSSTGATRGVLGVTYFDEVYTSFSGAIVLTLVLSDDVERVVVIEDVALEEGEQAWWVIDAGSQVRWADVDLVWVELVPAE